jgi:uncharacterized protein (DUF1800 family)
MAARTVAVALVLWCAGTGSATATPLDDPLAPLPAAEWTRAQAAHLLRRAGFGGTPAEIDALHARGLDGAVEWLVDFRAIPDPLPRFPYRHTGPPAKGLDMAAMSPAERRARFKEWRRDDVWQCQQVKAWWLDRMVRSPRPLQERLTLFWHGHFCSGMRDVRNSFQLLLQNQRLRSFAAGSFRTLLREIARDPAMLEYLDNKTNRQEHPNENFAREVMELFVLGIGHYTEQDIKEAARAFTGWTSAGNQFVVRERWHDDGEKTVLGRTGRFTGDDVLEILLAQPSAAEHVAGKLFRHFAHEAPAPAVVQGLAATLRANDWQLRPMLRQLFRSRAFYDPRAVGTQIKGPIDLVVGLCRAMGVTRVPEGVGIVLCGGAAQIGQELLEPPNVKGWAGGRDWISTSTLLGRYNLASGLVASPREIARFVRQTERRLTRRAQQALEDVGLNGPEPVIDLSGWAAFDVETAVAGAGDAGAQVDALCARFLAVPAPAALRATLIAYLEAAPGRPEEGPRAGGAGRHARERGEDPRSGGGGRRDSPPADLERLHGALRLLVSTPEFQLQ